MVRKHRAWDHSYTEFPSASKNSTRESSFMTRTKGLSGSISSFVISIVFDIITEFAFLEFIEIYTFSPAPLALNSRTVFGKMEIEQKGAKM